MLVYNIKMSISPEVTKEWFSRTYDYILEIDMINSFKEGIQELNEQYENTTENNREVIQLLKYSVLLEIKMMDYIKNNNPDMVLKFINKILKCMNDAMELAETISDNIYFETCEMAKDDYNRLNKFKNVLESLQS